MRLVNAVALSASLLVGGLVQANAADPDLEQMCMHIEDTIVQTITPDQSDDCFEALHYANANTLEAELNIHDQSYDLARNDLLEVVNGLRKAVESNCLHLETICRAFDETITLIEALPSES